MSRDESAAASPSRVALAVKGWRCFLGWHRWKVRSVVGRYISGRGFGGAYEVYQECGRCGEERSYMEWNRRVGAKLEEAVCGRSCPHRTDPWHQGDPKASAASTLRPVVMADSATPADAGPYFVGYGDEWREFAEWEDAWEHCVMRGSTIGQSHIKVRAEAL